MPYLATREESWRVRKRTIIILTAIVVSAGASAGAARSVTSYGVIVGRLLQATARYSSATSRLAFAAASNPSPPESPDSTDECQAAEDMAEPKCDDRSATDVTARDWSRLRAKHRLDPNLWMYHVESTTSTMDASKRLVEDDFALSEEDAGSRPSAFMLSATSQTNGRGTSKRNWKSNQRGNAAFTIGIQQSSWMADLKSANNGAMVPLTLLPLKIGASVALSVNRTLAACVTDERLVPKVSVKWPNDVLLSSEIGAHEKVSGVLIESVWDWFLIGIGINVGYAPEIPKEGADYGRSATCISKHCDPTEDADEEYWIGVSKNLARDIAYDLHAFFDSPSAGSGTHSGEAILDQWKSYIDWDMELVLRDTPDRERVRLREILPDGRVVVQEVDSGATRTLVSDYFL